MDEDSTERFEAVEDVDEELATFSKGAREIQSDR
jgi:hypothetical protein